jgi:hypothetical protein
MSWRGWRSLNSVAGTSCPLTRTEKAPKRQREIFNAHTYLVIGLPSGHVFGLMHSLAPHKLDLSQQAADFCIDMSTLVWLASYAFLRCKTEFV